MTNARGVVVMSKTKNMRKAVTGQVDVDIKTNSGVFKNRDSVDWERAHGNSG